MLDDEEIGRLGVLEGMLDGETAFAVRAKYRLSARKGYVKPCNARQPHCQLYTVQAIWYVSVENNVDEIVLALDARSNNIWNLHQYGPHRPE